MLHVAAGDRVRSGQRLVTLDARELEARRAEAASRVAALERAVEAAAADRESATAALDLAAATHGRIAGLAARRSATPQELDQAIAARRESEGRVRSAQARAEAASADLDAGRAAAEAAVVDASYAVLTAPFDGLVTETLVERGDMAAPGVPVLRLEDTSRFRVDVRLDESRAVRVHIGQHVDLSIGETEESGEPHVVLQGQVAEMARTLDPDGHWFLVKIQVARGVPVQSGMFARARFAVPARETLTVPLNAVVVTGQLSTVFVITGQGRARMRVVNLGSRSDSDVEVLSGLTADERVVASPPPTLRDGAIVKLTAPSRAAGSPPQS
jgi:RND family efflux transporter MFP subunit